jgi:ribosome-binding ATPase YchF (GTP1/OBG family)
MRYARFIQGTGSETSMLAMDMKDKYKRYAKVRDDCQKAVLRFNNVYPQPLDWQDKKLSEFVSHCLSEATQMLIKVNALQKEAENLDILIDETYKRANPKMNY